jgi:hypothetical protein
VVSDGAERASRIMPGSGMQRNGQTLHEVPCPPLHRQRFDAGRRHPLASRTAVAGRFAHRQEAPRSTVAMGAGRGRRSIPTIARYCVRLLSLPKGNGRRGEKSHPQTHTRAIERANQTSLVCVDAHVSRDNRQVCPYPSIEESSLGVISKIPLTIAARRSRKGGNIAKDNERRGDPRRSWDVEGRP